MALWREVHPGFWLPPNIDARQFPPYGDFDPDLPDPLELIRLPWGDPALRWAYPAWKAAQRADRAPRIPAYLMDTIAWRAYGQARYEYLVPQWRRWMSDLATEIDDIEDQLSTITWLLQGLGRKLIPIPPGVFSAADDLRRSLDAAQDVLQYTGSSRGAKSDFLERQREQRRRQRAARSRMARIVVWLQANYGRLLEAAQATGTWFDMGIVLGPIFSYIEEGLFGVANATLENYLIAVEAFLPGYSEDFRRNATELREAVQLELADAMEWAFDQQTIDDEFTATIGM